MADRPQELFDGMQTCCDGYAAVEVVYALGMMIAHAIAEQATDKNPDVTFGVLREVVDMELPRISDKRGK